MIIEVLFLIAVSLSAAAAQVKIKDIGVAMPLVLQLWMLSLPILYPLSAVPTRALTLYRLNPMAGVIENFRRVMLYGQAPDLPLLGISAAITLVLLPISYIYFKHVEATVADVL